MYVEMLKLPSPWFIYSIKEEREALGKLRVLNRRRGRRSLRPSTPSQPRVAQQNPNSMLGRSSDNLINTLDCFSDTIPPQTCRTCGILVLFWILIPLASVAIGFWRSFATGDEGKGFTDAAFIVAAGGMIMYPIQRMHNRKCILRRLNGEWGWWPGVCWKKLPWTKSRYEIPGSYLLPW